MMIGRDATIDDAKAVLANLSEITRADIEAHDMSDADIMDTVQDYFNTGTAHVLLEDGNPLVVVGIAWMGDYWNCWLVAAEGFWSVRPSIWRMLRLYSQTVLAAMNEDFHSFSASPHPALSRWMAALGFKEVEQDGKFRHFIYSR